MKIAVMGIGGVGGYMAGMLGRTGSTLTLVTRGAKTEALKKDGIILHSDLNGEIRVKPDRVVGADEIGEQDIIFLTVKTFGLEEACGEIRDKISDDTIIVPVMNGVDTSDRVRRALGKGIVIDSVIYIVTFFNSDNTVTQQGVFATVKYGIKSEGTLSEKEKDALEKVTALFNEAGLDSEQSNDIEADIWKKYILNCAFNVETAYYDNTIGELQSDKIKSAEYEELVRESYRVAKAKGVNLTDKDLDEVIKKFYAYGPELTSSLQRDIRDGKSTENEIFGGYLTREADRYGVPVPISERMYEGIKNRL